MLAIHDLHVAYGPILALRGVSFAVPEGAIIALVPEGADPQVVWPEGGTASFRV